MPGDEDLPALYTASEEDSNAYGGSFDGWYDITEDLTWSSEDSSIATSSGDGVFQGVSDGETYVYADGEALAPETQDGDDPEYIDLQADLEGQYCPGDTPRSAVMQEYVDYHAAHTNFFAGGLPACADFSNTRHSSSFSFGQINTGDYSVALVRAPLIDAASSGHGLDRWVAQYGSSRTINSAFRNPARNAAVGGQGADSNPGGHTGSRHMYGDAADLNNASGTLAGWSAMITAANNSDPDFVEPQNGPCGISCAHADWRNHGGGYQ